MIETDPFTELVLRMRNMQKAYFRTRSPGNLAAAKALENDVDAMLKTYEAKKLQQKKVDEAWLNKMNS